MSSFAKNTTNEVTSNDSAQAPAIGKIISGAKLASSLLAGIFGDCKNKALIACANEIAEHSAEILAANERDVNTTKRLVQSGELPEAFLKRLKLDSSKLDDIISGIKEVAALEDPIGKVTLARELDNGLNLYRVACPIGVIAVIFESRPDALPQIASLCLKSSNAVILKGGKEAEHSNKALFHCIRRAVEREGVPPDAIALIETREDVKALLEAEGQIDLIIPRGSNSLVKQIQTNTKIPVLGHAEGVCHLYIDEFADLRKAIAILIDCKVQYPAACNSIETLLVHKRIAGAFIPAAIAELKKHSVQIRIDPDLLAQLKVSLGAEQTKLAFVDDWSKEYGDLVIAVKLVSSVDEAIEHINLYGSHHTDAIITERASVFDRFFQAVKSAGVYWNASTRFADGFRYGFGAEVGISTGKLHPRGPVGLDGLVTYKYKLIGNGQIVADYMGPNAKRFTHKTLDHIS